MNPKVLWGILAASAVITAILVATGGGESREEKRQRELERHVRRMRTTYLTRRDAMVRHLRERLGGALTFDVPRGGISLWCTVAPGIDIAAWLTACAAQGIHVSPGSRYTFASDDPGAFRLVFAPLTPAEIDRATAVMAKALTRRRAGS